MDPYERGTPVRNPFQVDFIDRTWEAWVHTHNLLLIASRLNQIMGDPTQAAEGLKEILGLENHTVLANLLKQSVEAIETEFLTYGETSLVAGPSPIRGFRWVRNLGCHVTKLAPHKALKLIS